MKRSKYDMTENIKPETNARYVGIEIEFCSPYDQEELLDELDRLKLNDYVTLKDDGSIYPDSSEKRCGECWGCEDGDPCDNAESYDYGHELCLLVKEKELTKVLVLVEKFFKFGKAYVNGTCGLHVHIDMRRRDEEKSFVNLVMAQDLLYRLCPSIRKSSTYCRPTKSTDIWSAQRDGRYQGINPCSLGEHNTLEVRIHQGTININEIAVWTKLLVKIADAKALKQKVNTGRTLKKCVDLPKYISKEITKRTRRYTKQHSKSA